MKKKQKPKILLVIDDALNWAYDNRAKCLIKNLSHKYNFEKITIAECRKKAKTYFEKFDCIFLFSWQFYSLLNFKLPKNKLLTGVFSWVLWDKKEKKSVIENLYKHKAVITNSLKLYKYLKNKHPNVYYAPNGVDTDIFYPIKKKPSDDFIIGWAGNPERTDISGEKIKGYYDILLPSVKGIKNIKLKTALFGKKQIPFEKMPKFYNSLDAYVCVSKSESTPNPCFEAAACGKPVITTKVGTMPQLIKHKYNGLFIKRNKKSLIKAIEYLRDNPEKTRDMGRNAAKIIKENWSWNKLIKNYEKVFDFIID